MSINITNIYLGAKYGGKCAVCGAPTGDRDFEKARTCVGKADGKFVVAHPKCVGWTTKNKIGGGVAGSGPASFETK